MLRKATKKIDLYVAGRHYDLPQTAIGANGFFHPTYWLPGGTRTVNGLAVCYVSKSEDLANKKTA